MRHVLVPIVLMLLGAAGLAIFDRPQGTKCHNTSWIGHPPHDTLPRRGTLFVRGDPRAWIGPGDLTEVAPRVWRIDFDVGVTHEEFRSHPRLRTTDEWRPRPAPPRLVDLSRMDGRLRATVDDGVAAFRARWTYEGTTTERIEVPRNNGTTGALKLWWIPEAELLDGGHLELVAIRFDGSEVAVEDMPDEVAFGTPRKVVALLLAIALALLLAPRFVTLTPAIAIRMNLPIARLVRRRRPAVPDRR